MSRPSILYVTVVGGPALEYSMPRLQRYGDVHALLFSTRSQSVEDKLRTWCKSVHWDRVGAPVPDAIVDTARRVAADAIVTFSEFAIIAVGAACEQLGLPGPGPNVARSRDKVAMRSVWREHGLPGPRFAAVRSLEDLRRAHAELRRPFLLKPALSAGSLGQVLIRDDTDLDAAWSTAAAAIDELERAGVCDLVPIRRGRQLIAEEIIDASTESWYEVDGFGDYLSVEGMVVGGRYHPICITARLPTIPPFIELSNLAPTVLSADRQRRIEEMARAAVDALGLGSCGTHTEIKLQRGQGLCLLESAARLGGAMIPREVNEAFGVDMIDALVAALLGRTPDLPDRMLTAGRPGAAVASLSMIATNARGESWATLPTFAPDRVDWSRLTAPDTEVEIVWGQTLPSGSRMPAFSPTGGTRNYAGTLFLRAPDPLAIQASCYGILNGLEAALQDM